MGERVGRPLRPERLHTTVGLVLALLLALAALQLFHATWTFWHVFAAWLLGVNTTTFGYYALDKMRARRGGRRVPEVVLHGLALVGGSVGAFAGMQVFRHKTLKGRFRLVFFVIVLVQVAIAGWIGYIMLRRQA